jgi:hypothetical protein
MANVGTTMNKIKRRNKILPIVLSGVHTVWLDSNSGGIRTSFDGAIRVEYPLEQNVGMFCK